ncbi:putative acetyltransferase [Posidoniimonas polymericola]|uniref:Putative acetyltransferase n=1 Tax=Posidoniimonas polymericola TaxID=2528002 RepID=A0A5C5YUA5_9BACT|nr:acyltransferase [Posidoniimonas polymericola]TWT78410.1 putative acetyltransferase [Posidoniimonas polymericola]
MFLKLARRTAQLPFKTMEALFIRLPYFHFVRNTRDALSPNTFRDWFRQELLGVNIGPYWPIHTSSKVTEWKNILIGIDTSPGIMPGCYIQGIGKVTVGDYTRVGPNVSIISANHSLSDLRQHEPQEVRIGAYCWLGAGSVVLPGVELGDFTIVGAGAIVTKSYPQGFCVLAGNPAVPIKSLSAEECVRYRHRDEYHGFIAARDFSAYRKNTLRV